MAEIEYRRDMGRNYILLREEISLEEGYFLKLIQNNTIKGILPLEIRTVNAGKECLWDVTGKQSLKAVFEGRGMDRAFLEEIIGKIQEVIKRGEEYLLRPEDYVLAAETIFLDRLDFSLYLCYAPGYQCPMEKKWRDFTEYLMNVADYKNEDMVLYVYGLYKSARQPEGFVGPQLVQLERKEKAERLQRICTDIPEFEERIEEDEMVEKYPVKIYIMAAGIIIAGLFVAGAGLFLWRPQPVQAAVFLMVVGAVTAYVCSRLFLPENKEIRLEHQVEYIPAKDPLREEAVFEWERQEEENTAILASEGMERKSFLRAEDKYKYQDIELIEFPFFFGKLKTQVNSSIESPAVSRFHAKIEYLGGEYYLVDLNSTNGTYLNGERLKSNERRHLEPGDKVRFADVGYYFEPVID